MFCMRVHVSHAGPCFAWGGSSTNAVKIATWYQDNANLLSVLYCDKRQVRMVVSWPYRYTNLNMGIEPKGDMFDTNSSRSTKK